MVVPLVKGPSSAGESALSFTKAKLVTLPTVTKRRFPTNGSDGTENEVDCDAADRDIHTNSIDARKDLAFPLQIVFGIMITALT